MLNSIRKAILKFLQIEELSALKNTISEMDVALGEMTDTIDSLKRDLMDEDQIDDMIEDVLRNKSFVEERDYEEALTEVGDELDKLKERFNTLLTVVKANGIKIPVEIDVERETQF